MILLAVFLVPGAVTAEEPKALAPEELLQRIDQQHPAIQHARGRLAAARAKTDARAEDVEAAAAALDQIRAETAANTRTALARFFGARAMALVADLGTETLAALDARAAQDRDAAAEVRRRRLTVVAARIAQLRADADRRLSDASYELFTEAAMSPAERVAIRGALAEGVPTGDPDLEALTKRALQARGEVRAARAAFAAALDSKEGGAAAEARLQQADHAVANAAAAVRGEVIAAARRFVAARRGLAACSLDPRWRAENWKRIAQAVSDGPIASSEALAAMRDALEFELQCVSDGVELATSDAELRRAAGLIE